jgi:Transposase DDE domain group 1
MISRMDAEKIFDKKTVSLEFTLDDTSSDGGLIFAKQVVDRLKMIDRITEKIRDPRCPDIEHPLRDMIGQRLYQIIAGYEDVNDSDKLKIDPILKMVVRDGSGLKKEERKRDLASSPTLCRMENWVGIREIHDLTALMVDLYLKRNSEKFSKKKDNLIIRLDLDPTDIETHGDQEKSPYNGYYKHTCYLPMMISDGDTGDVVTAFLRPGNRHASFLLIPVLKRIFEKIEKRYPNVRFSIRADSGFQSEELFWFLEQKKNVTYTIGLINNPALSKSIEWPQRVLSLGERLYGEFGYQADSWRRFRRVVYQIESKEKEVSCRLYVTNDWENTPDYIKGDYNRRAELENRIKELKLQCYGSRLSCDTFQANAFRFAMATFSYIVLQEIKKRLDGTDLEKSYAGTLREKIIKVATIIKEKTTRIIFLMPKSYPYQKIWYQLLCPA